MLSVIEEPKDPLKKGMTPIRSKATAGAVESVGSANPGPTAKSKTKARAEARVLLSPGEVVFFIGRHLRNRSPVISFG
jgi:hypothetical protein